MNSPLKSVQHPLVKEYVRLQSKRSYRYEKKRVVVEGVKLVEELLRFRTPLSVLTTHPEQFPQIDPSVLYPVSLEILKKVSSTIQPEVVVAEFSMPEFSPLDRVRKLLVLERISDPGNLGTLLRTALALGWDGAFLIEPCCDPFNSKAIRAAKGATFHLPIRLGSFEECEDLIKRSQLPSFCADLNGEAITNLSPTDSCALLLGSESHGVSDQAKSFCQPVTIPMREGVESLNVSQAGAILLMHLNPYK